LEPRSAETDRRLPDRDEEIRTWQELAKSYQDRERNSRQAKRTRAEEPVIWKVEVHVSFSFNKRSSEIHL
jgi:hypothetical protein